MTPEDFAALTLTELTTLEGKIIRAKEIDPEVYSAIIDARERAYWSKQLSGKRLQDSDIYGLDA